MRSRSGMIAISAVVAIVAGALLIFGGSTSGADEGDDTKVSVVVATGALVAGSTADDALSGGQVVLREIDEADVRDGALTSLGSLAGRTFVTEVADGAQVVDSSLSRPALRNATISVPAGTEAVSIDVPFANGGAGYFAPGDLVNVLAVPTDQLATAGLQTVLESVEVLDVSAEVAPRVASQRTATTVGDEAVPAPIPTRLTYLVAVPTDQVPLIVAAISYGQVYLTLPAQAEE